MPALDIKFFTYFSFYIFHIFYIFLFYIFLMLFLNFQDKNKCFVLICISLSIIEVKSVTSDLLMYLIYSYVCYRVLFANIFHLQAFLLVCFGELFNNITESVYLK